MKIGNGFGFKVVQAVLYTLVTLVFIAVGIMFTVRSADFLGLMIETGGRNNAVSIKGFYREGVFYESNNYMTGGETYYCRIAYGNGEDSRLEFRGKDKTTEEMFEAVYAFIGGDDGRQLLTFSDGNETVTVKYSDFTNGYYMWDEFKVMSVIFFVLGGVLAAVDVLHIIATVKGRKSMGANVLGIVVNTPFALGAFGLCGLIGCVKGRMYLQFTEAGYGAGAQPQGTAQPQTAAVTAGEAVNQMGVNEAGISDAQTAEEGQPAPEAAQRQTIRKSEFKLDLYDASVDEKTWKEFRKTASQEELAVIAIGAKYRVAHSRIKNILYTIGIILSIALFWPTGGYSLIGYPVFAFLATKSIRYEDTLSQAYRKLDKEYKALVDGYFNCGIGWKILDIIIKLGIFYLTIPYQAILLFIGLFAPNFVISKNGILVSIPKGYDVGNLGAVGEYYLGFKFIDEALGNKGASSAPAQSGSPADDYYKKDAYTYTDANGYEQTVYSGDGKEFYDAGGHYVGSSGDGGYFKKKD